MGKIRKLKIIKRFEYAKAYFYSVKWENHTLKSLKDLKGLTLKQI